MQSFVDTNCPSTVLRKSVETMRTTTIANNTGRYVDSRHDGAPLIWMQMGGYGNTNRTHTDGWWHHSAGRTGDACDLAVASRCDRNTDAPPQYEQKLPGPRNGGEL